MPRCRDLLQPKPQPMCYSLPLAHNLVSVTKPHICVWAKGHPWEFANRPCFPPPANHPTPFSHSKLPPRVSHRPSTEGVPGICFESNLHRLSPYPPVAASSSLAQHCQTPQSLAVCCCTVDAVG